jgi:DNA-binding CsgD family transcriptional regulator
VEQPNPLGAAAQATNEVAVAVIRVGFGLMAAVAASDLLFAALARANATTLAIGALFTAAAAVGLLYPDAAARLLCRRGRALWPAVLFAAVGALDPGVQIHYPEVASAIVWIAVITSSTGIVGLCVALSAAGYIADLAIQGHTAAWLLNGPGRDLIANQVIDLTANAGGMLLLIAILRWFVGTAPQRIAEVHRGGRSLTPQLALAARGSRLALPRADPFALTERFTTSERNVLALLATGRSPKQAARDLVVSLATVRSHLASAKRKCGARTLDQLVAIYTEATLEQ